MMEKEKEKKKNIYIYIWLPRWLSSRRIHLPSRKLGFDGLAGYESMGLQKSQIQVSGYTTPTTHCQIHMLGRVYMSDHFAPYLSSSNLMLGRV